MTGLLLHGIAWETAACPRNAEPHARISAGGLVALATPLAPGSMSDSSHAPVEEALCHHRLLSAYAVSDDVLPVRFGTVVPEGSAATSLLVADARRWKRELARLAGCVEYTVSVSEDEALSGGSTRADPSDAESGRAFLAHLRSARDARRSKARTRARYVEALSTTLSGATRSLVRLPRKRMERLAGFALLVERPNEAALVDLLRSLIAEGERLGLRTVLSAPSPCYSFVFSSENEISASAVPGKSEADNRVPANA